MKERVLHPPKIISVNEPLIFLGGPIQGSRDWQSQAIEIIHANLSEVLIANPRRDYLDGKFIYEDQVNWETYYLRQAGEKRQGQGGVILFYLAKEMEVVPGRAYAQTSRFEIGEWITWHRFQKAELVVGIESGFSGARYIRQRLGEYPEIQIQTSLEGTCLEAVKRISTIS